MVLTNRLNKTGFLLIEVMISTLIIGIIAVGAGASIVYATKQRMTARIREAALIETQSLMENVYATVNTNTVSSGNSGQTNSVWTFDGVNYNEQVTFTNSSGILQFEARVYCHPNRPITLYGEKYIGFQ